MVTVKKSQGFTLIELMIVLIIITVGASMSVGLVGLVHKGRLTGQINTLIGAISMARSEAIKQGDSVTICGANTALNSCSGLKMWSEGWIVFSDENDNGQVNGNDKIIRVFPGLGKNKLEYGTGNAGGNRITYGGNGRMTGVFNGTFTLRSDDVSEEKEVKVSPRVGRARIVTQ